METCLLDCVVYAIKKYAKAVSIFTVIRSKSTLCQKLFILEYKSV